MYFKKTIGEMGKYILGIIGGIFFIIVFLNILIVHDAKDQMVRSLSQLREAEAVLILGAGVYKNETLTPIFKARVDAALEVYKSGKVEKILVSGDNSTRQYNEVVPVRTYLLEKGVPESDIFLDFAGFDTYDSIYRAQSIFEVHSAVIVTQSFHLPRSIYIANRLGLSAQGFIPFDDEASWKNYPREFAARVKAFLDVALHARPTYEGKEIPISGDGRRSLVP